MRRLILSLWSLCLLLSPMVLSNVGCKNAAVATSQPVASSTIALTSDDSMLWVVNPDSDSVTVIDARARTRLAEVALAPMPVVDPTSKRYEPAVKPRALAILPGDQKIYVAGQTANHVFVIDAATRAVTSSIAVGAEPVGIVAAQDGSAVYVVSHEGNSVARIDPHSDTVTATISVGEHPWGASLSADGKSLYVSQLLLVPGVTVIDTASFTVRNNVVLAEQMPDTADGKLVPNGVARGAYSAIARPVGGDIWIPHMLLAVKTAEPDLDFESTIFPTISTLQPDATAESKRLLFKPLAVPGATGSFDDVISGPRALAFTPDGTMALLANSGSEDVMVFDGASGDELALVRPLPSTFIEGIAIDHAGAYAYVNGRNSHDVTVLAITPNDAITPVAVDGSAIDCLATDPMPSDMRHGQRLFYTANSAAFPITQNFWMSCSSCHLEGQSDAVTWLFVQGPRDTPSNAGGPINTGFLERQALRNAVVQYDATDVLEQGGSYHYADAAQKPDLDALSTFVNYAIPFPQNPYRSADGTLTASQTRGQALFTTECASCHSGAYLTDSGAGNPTLDMNGTILLHDTGPKGLGTCVQTGAFQDQSAPDEVVGNLRTPCDFDTPTLRGIFATAPYFHDGSSPSLADAVKRLPFSTQLDDGSQADLVAYLQTL